MQEIANILKISKSIKLLVKMKNMCFILQKNLYRLFGQPNRRPHVPFHLNTLVSPPSVQRKEGGKHLRQLTIGHLSGQGKIR